MARYGCAARGSSEAERSRTGTQSRTRRRSQRPARPSQRQQPPQPQPEDLKMRATKHIAATHSTSMTDGLRALLGSLLGTKGTGAPSATSSTGTGAPCSALHMKGRGQRYAPALVGLALAAALAGVAAPANAAEQTSPWWGLTAGSRPSSLPPEGKGLIVVTAQDLGDAGANGGTAPVTISDVLPAGLEATAVKGIAETASRRGTVARSPAKEKLNVCEMHLPREKRNAKKEKEVVPATLPAFEQIEVADLRQRQADRRAGEVNAVSAPARPPGVASASHPIVIGEGELFGFEDWNRSQKTSVGPSTRRRALTPSSSRMSSRSTARPRIPMGIRAAPRSSRTSSANCPPG